MRLHRIVAVIALAGALVFSGSALAQKKKGQGAGKAKAAVGVKASVRGELMEHLYPIELVRHFAADLKLTEDQIEQLRKLVRDVQIEVEDLKWGLAKESNALVDLVAGDATKDRIYEQMDSIFKYENKLKKKQMGLMICIRDVLTKKQRAFLDKVKQEHMKKGPPPPHGGFGQPGPGGPHPPDQGGPAGPTAPF